MKNLYFQWDQEKGPKRGVIVKVEIEYNRPFFISCEQNQCCKFWVILWSNYATMICFYVLLKEFLKLEVETSGYIYPKIEDIFHFVLLFRELAVGTTVLKAIVAHPQKRFVLFFCRGKQRHINCCSDTAITVGLDTSTYQNQIHVRL